MRGGIKQWGDGRGGEMLRGESVWHLWARSWRTLVGSAFFLISTSGTRTKTSAWGRIY